MRLPAIGMAIVFLAGPVVAVADELEDAIQSLKEATAKKDVDAVKKLAADLLLMTCENGGRPRPGQRQKKIWEERVTYAKNAEVYVESALAGTAIQSPPAVMVDFIVALEQNNPKSKYLDEVYGPYLVAL